MTGDDGDPLHGEDGREGQGSAAARVPAFPYLRRRGPLALIGLTTAVPTSLLMSTGQLGAAQIAKTANCWRGFETRGFSVS